MIRALAILALLACAGCSHRDEYRRVNQSVIEGRVGIPVFLASPACLQERHPELVDPGGWCGQVSDGTWELWVANYYWQEYCVQDAIRVTSHEILAHLQPATDIDSRNLLRLMDPGSGLWMRHAAKSQPPIPSE
jgi:hypothetical protein